jgi:tryptophanase
VLPVHQGRAAENIICKTFVKNGSAIPMNYHFTTTAAHIALNGGRHISLVADGAFQTESDCPFKGNFDIGKLTETIAMEGVENIPFIRIETCTNLLGGQPISLENIYRVADIAKKFGIMLVMDACLLAENLFFIRNREKSCAGKDIRAIAREISSPMDIIYFSARKLGCGRGGAIVTANRRLFDRMKSLVPLYEGSLTYGGMSLREMEAVTVGLDEAMDPSSIGQAPGFIEFTVAELQKRGIPMVTPPGALGAHIDAARFLPHVRREDYPAGALTAALFLTAGIRGMEQGTLSSVRGPDGRDIPAAMELVRLALPRRVFTLSQVKFAVDRIAWLHSHRHLIGGLTFTEEPETLRSHTGKLAPIGQWDEQLAHAIRQSGIE